MTFTYNEITGAIYRMAYKRLAKRGKEYAIAHLLKSRDTVWKNNKDIREFINRTIQEVSIL